MLPPVVTQRDTKVCELSFKTAVLAVKLNRKRLVVVLESCMHIYDITVMKLLHSVETPPNPKGWAVWPRLLLVVVLV